MNIDRFKHEHQAILDHIDGLRRLTHAGALSHAADIAHGIVAMSSTIKLHLAVEDRVLYPALRQGADGDLARLGAQFQSEMGTIAATYMDFARRWNTAEQVRRDPDGFRADANVVLRSVYERMLREDRDFYPRIEEQELLAA